MEAVGLDGSCEEGVGERRKASEKVVETEEAGIVGEVGASVKACVAGMGVETPRALASFARRWGGRGERGAGHAGCVWLGEVGERWVELPVLLR